MAEILDLNNENIESQNQTPIDEIKFQPIKSFKLIEGGLDDITIDSIKDNFEKINQNFSKIVAAEYLKGDKGNNVKIIEVAFKLGDDTQIKKDGKSIYLDGSPVTGNDIVTQIGGAIGALAESEGVESGGLDHISNICWDDNLKGDQHISFIIEEENDIYNIKSSLWYVYNDPRFANPQDDEKYSELFNTSCVVYYDGAQFKAHQPFPTIYYHQTKGFCWKINNEKTEISARGIQGLPGNSYPVYIVKYNTETASETEVEIISIFSEDVDGWITVGTDINKYDNCTAICLPDIDSDDASKFAGQSIYLSILNVYPGQSQEKPKLKAAIGAGLNLTSYFLSNNLFDLMANNSVKKLFIPYVSNDSSSHTQVFEMTDENTLAMSIRNSKPNTNTTLQLSYNNVNINNGEGKVNGRATSLDWDLTQQTRGKNGNANNCHDSLSLRKYIVNKDIDNMFPTEGNDNSILWIGGGTEGRQGHQLGFSNNGNIYHRVSKPVGDKDREYTPWCALNQQTANVTYEELVGLRNGNALIPGQKYRIIDFESKFAKIFDVDGKTYNIESARHKFDIIIEAIDTKTLSENAKACLHDDNDDNDDYFKDSKLEAWELKYCLDNNKYRFSWADTESGKGVIYYMKDEFENEAFYDFKNLLFVHKYESVGSDDIFDKPYEILKKICIWDEDKQIENSSLSISHPETETFQINYYTFSYFNLDNTKVLSEISYTKENDLYVAYSSDFSKGSSCRNNKILTPGVYFYQLRENIFINTNKTILKRSAYCGSNTLLNNCNGNYFGQYAHSNTLNEYCQYNTIHHNSFENIFGKECTNNVINYDCNFNIFEHRCSENILGGKCDNNTFGQGCSKNILGEICNRNIFGQGCSENILGGKCDNNTFGQGCILCSLEGYNRGSFNNIFENNCINVHLTNIKFIVNNILKYGSSAFIISGNTWGNMPQDLEIFKNNLLDYSYRNNKIGAGSQDLLIIPGIYSNGANYKVGYSDTDLTSMSNSGVTCSGFICPFYKGANNYTKGLSIGVDYSIQNISIYQNTTYFAYIVKDQSYIKFNYYTVHREQDADFNRVAEGWNVLHLKNDNADIANILGIPIADISPRDIPSISITKDKLFKILVYPIDGNDGINTGKMVLYHPSSEGRTQFSSSF